MLMKPVRENILRFLTVVDFTSQVPCFYTVAETKDGEQHLAGNCRLPAGIVVLSDTVVLERPLT